MFHPNGGEAVQNILYITNSQTFRLTTTIYCFISRNGRRKQKKKKQPSFTNSYRFNNIILKPRPRSVTLRLVAVKKRILFFFFFFCVFLIVNFSFIRLNGEQNTR